jgi:hypothetical protein
MLGCKFKGKIKEMENHLKDPVSLLDHLTRQSQVIRDMKNELTILHQRQCNCSEKISEEVEECPMSGLFD